MLSDTQNTLIFITPTYDRPNRTAYLRRCAEVFKTQQKFVWIIIEDGLAVDAGIREMLNASGVQFQYLAFGPTRCWGNQQRNFALEYIRRNEMKGIIYFADDDNYYDPRLFDELRKTKQVSIMPVGLLGPGGIERPIVKYGKITEWSADWKSRKFPVDMASFAFNAEILATLKEPLWPFCPEDKQRGGETEFLERIVTSADEFEILCNDCKTCYVWHDLPLHERPQGYYFKRYRLAPTMAFIKKMMPYQIRQILKKIFRKCCRNYI
jgi:glycosyltransferase involved in cell wall biosynthesis